jgi:hypothetical protein
MHHPKWVRTTGVVRHSGALLRTKPRMSAISPVRGFIRGFVRRKGRTVRLWAAAQDMSRLLSSSTLNCGGRLASRPAHARSARGPQVAHLQLDAIHCAGTLCPRRRLLRIHRSRQYRQEPQSCSERRASALAESTPAHSAERADGRVCFLAVVDPPAVPEQRLVVGRRPDPLLIAVRITRPSVGTAAERPSNVVLRFLDW